MRLLILLSVILFSCSKDNSTDTPIPTAYRQTKTISYNSVSVDVIIDKPAKNDLDVLYPPDQIHLAYPFDLGEFY